ncbi:TPA: rhomboid family intramembrane serine protease [archaeon]|jgi:membrane associated rhomboid family serine protease|uniref:Rhomboid family intramembrane serine protease n=1 Tax=Candidatus Undinarchaeum marinum TaxID=2756141 RepID=A0A832ULX8_9ARCH|nr:rhomboid family intramembrane serine protease [Candidatus Undinarchaeum marinum]
MIYAEILASLFILIGLAYLFVVIVLSFKERKKVAWLVILNIAIFTYISFSDPRLMYEYMLSGTAISSNAGYALVTYMFLHANFTHLFLNSIALLFFGYHVEREFGAGQMIFVYLTSGLIAGGFFILTSSPNASVVGASGAIFGLMAYLTLLRPFKISPMPFLIPLPIALAAVLYTVATIPLFLSGNISGGISHSAHIGGLLGGSIMAFGLNYIEARRGLLIVLAILILILMMPVVAF